MIFFYMSEIPETSFKRLHFICSYSFNEYISDINSLRRRCLPLFKVASLAGAISTVLGIQKSGPAKEKGRLEMWRVSRSSRRAKSEKQRFSLFHNPTIASSQIRRSLRPSSASGSQAGHLYPE